MNGEFSLIFLIKSATWKILLVMFQLTRQRRPHLFSGRNLGFSVSLVHSRFVG